MNLTIPNLKSLTSRFAFSLESALHTAWWILLVAFLALLFADALVFYQYGLGRSAPPPGGGEPAAVSVDEAAIRGAALLLERRKEAFAQPPSAPADFPNPFR